ncbi:UNKNOWN [Stylonychia lemnae]|uniref:Uncharacterized protein n=1 Tax=Stylonychia lemnae TaxID=5949 RepID=A0A078A2U5_STYLE|nr:UNKNOWN [Stylonychia lemnae]|eukprot:CDW75094.1 UNKNOWN [Stylonychia lemnae]
MAQNLTKTSFSLSNLIQCQTFGYKRSSVKVFDFEFKKDLAEYNQEFGVLRKKHKKEYWEHQTQVENTFLDKFREEGLQKQRRDLDRWRTRICTISMSTKNEIKALEKKEDKLLVNMTRQDVLNTRRAMQTKIMLDVMEIDSKRWPSLAEMNERINEHVVLPQTIMNYEEYQRKIQTLAFYNEQGDHENMQKLLDKEESMEKKNVLLQPIYRDLKSMIRHMSNNEEFKLLKEYMDARQLITENFPESSEKGKEGLEKLEQEYAKLLRNYKRSLQEPSKRLKTMQKRLEDLFNLVSLWSQYVDIIYMPDAEIDIIDAVNKTEARPEDDSFASKAEAKDVKNRMDILFGRDTEGKRSKKSVIANGEEDPYETVNEGVTTDTTEATEKNFKRTTAFDDDDNLAAKRDLMQDEESTPQGKKGEVEEGILSSDEEQIQSKSDPLINNPNQRHNISKTISSFQDESQKQLFKDDKEKEVIEMNYNLADQDLERYKAKLTNKADVVRGRLQSQDDDYEDKKFVSQTNYESQLNTMNMQNLNLFGVQIGDSEDSQNQMNKGETAKILQDLLDLTDQFDSGEMQDFSYRKSFPYDQEEAAAYSALKFEDELRLRASVVLDYYIQQVRQLKDEELSFTDKEKKDQVLKLITQLSNVKIVDAPVLMKIYDIYRLRL